MNHKVVYKAADKIKNIYLGVQSFIQLLQEGVCGLWW